MQHSWTLVLTGPYAGQTITLAGYSFVRGELTLEGPFEAWKGVFRYLGKSYQAYLRGSDELALAQARDAEHKQQKQEAADGERDIPSTEQDTGADGDVGDPEPERDGPSAPEADDGGGPADPDDGGEGSIPDGDGYGDSGVPEEGGGEDEDPPVLNRMLAAAVHSLDPGNDDHWTDGGKPRMSAVEEAYGSADVTRRDVDEAAPGYDRGAALAKAL